MIQLTFADGSKRWLDHHAAVSLQWGEMQYDWSEVRRMMVIDPVVRVADGKLRGMPIRGLVLEDTTDLLIEVPMTVTDAQELGEQLKFGTQIARPKLIRPT